LSLTDKSNENYDHIVAFSKLLEEFCKQIKRFEVPKISELQDVLNMDVSSETSKAKFHLCTMHKVTPSYS